MCTVYKAALGDEQAFKWLVYAMAYNRTQVAYTTFPCECTPKCQAATKEQVELLSQRVKEALAAMDQEWDRTHPRPSVPDFSKIMLPAIKKMMPGSLIDQIISVQPMAGPEDKS